MFPPSNILLVNLWCQWKFSDNGSEAEYGKKQLSNIYILHLGFKTITIIK